MKSNSKKHDGWYYLLVWPKATKLILDLPTINKISKISGSKFVENGVSIHRI